jgi:signal peptidase
METTFTRSVASARSRGSAARRLAQVAALALTVAVALVWFFVLRPVSLGGPADYVIVSGHSMEPDLHTGDVVVAFHQHRYEVGDVVVYRVPQGEPAAGDRVIHRIVGGSATKGFVMKGDNKQGIDPWRPTERDVVGKEIVTVPRIGTALAEIRSTLGVAIVAGLTTILVALGAASRPARDDEKP